MAITDKEAIQIIVGEAADQGFRGMIMVGEVIRHRNSAKGFYGANADHVNKEPAWVWKMAAKAYTVSKNTNYTFDATMMENIIDFGKPYWYDDYIVTVRYKKHTFMRRKNV